MFLQIKHLVENIEQVFFWTNDNKRLCFLKQEVFNQINHLSICITANEFFKIDRKFLAAVSL